MRRAQRIEPQAGQESVWDYPRPPRVEDTQRHVQVYFNGVLLADTHRARRVLETSHPPVYYIPPEDVRMEYLTPTERATFCEFKGAASYYTLRVNGKVAEDAAWFYSRPLRGYESIRNYIAFYPSRVESCFVDGERVLPQPGDFYGGWVTSEIIGPFKGGPGTYGW